LSKDEVVILYFSVSQASIK